jgi:hypothetical protein
MQEMKEKFNKYIEILKKINLRYWNWKVNESQIKTQLKASLVDCITLKTE